MIKELDEDLEASQDLEVEFAIVGAVRECSGLEILLEIVQVCYHFLIMLYSYWYGAKLINEGQPDAKAFYRMYLILLSSGRVIAEAGTMTNDLY